MLKCIRIALFLTMLVLLANAQSNLQQLNLLSNNSAGALSVFFQNNPAIQTALTKNTTLVMNTQFIQLFSYILNNQTIAQITLANISTLNPLKWTRNMTMTDTRSFLIVLLNQSLSLFYQMMTASYYPATQIQCQAALTAFLATNSPNVASNLLAPITGQYFWNKRCILSSQGSLLNIFTQKISVLTMDQKMLLIPVIMKMNVVHSLVFGMN